MTPDPLDALRLPIVPVDPRPEFAAALLRRITPRPGPHGEPPGRQLAATVRYFVSDLDTAVGFYCRHLGFEEELRTPPGFAMLYRGDLRLLLSVPGTPGAGRAMPDGSLPEPGGWNRIALGVTDIGAAVGALRGSGVPLRTGVVTGVGVRQAVVADPSGNLIELFEPVSGYHERARENDTRRNSG
jgi:catechol 2,3-dioxygenase-like lactoylglutathione lyase family enzyme